MSLFKLNSCHELPIASPPRLTLRRFFRSQLPRFSFFIYRLFPFSVVETGKRLAPTENSIARSSARLTVLPSLSFVPPLRATSSPTLFIPFFSSYFPLFP